MVNLTLLKKVLHGIRKENKMKNINIGFVLRNTIKTLALCVLFVCSFYLGAVSTALHLQSTKMNTQTNGTGSGFKYDLSYTVWVEGEVVQSGFDFYSLHIRTDILVTDFVIYEENSRESYLRYLIVEDEVMTINEWFESHSQALEVSRKVSFTCKATSENLHYRSFWFYCEREFDEE